tara:strand:- start:541 stop:834 length:294 start_codon:yes stop_codon:yes gene_type:complete
MAFKMKGFKAHDMYLGENNKKWSHKKPSGKHAHVVAKNENAHNILAGDDGAFTKKVSWMYGGKKYSGDFIRETKDKIFARTHNNKVKTIVKGKTKRG